MIRYIAFLRGINVGGHNPIKMEELIALFEGLGFSGIKTLLLTGNVLFDADSADPVPLSQRIESALAEKYGYRIPVMVIALGALKAIAGRDPFQGKTASDRVKLYLALLESEPAKDPALPLLSPKGDIELLYREGRLVFTAGYENGGRFGFPNDFVERSFGVAATSRNWNTITKLFKDSKGIHSFGGGLEAEPPSL